MRRVALPPIMGVRLILLTHDIDHLFKHCFSEPNFKINILLRTDTRADYYRIMRLAGKVVIG